MFHKHAFGLLDARWVAQYHDPSYGYGSRVEMRGYHTYLDAVCFSCGKVKTVVVKAKLDTVAVARMASGLGWKVYQTILPS